MYRLIVAAAICGSFFLTSCHRTTSEFWEDSKTCGRYMKRGMDAFFGKHSGAEKFVYKHPESNDRFEAWDEGERYEIPVMQDYAYDEATGPGDPGSLIPGVEQFIVPTGAMASLFSQVYFDTDNYSIRGDQNMELLRGIAEYLCTHPNTYVYIEGHCDQRGSAAYNLSLGSKRANSVKSFLVQHGVNPDQLFTISFGKEKLLAAGNDEASWSKNRRSQFKLYAR